MGLTNACACKRSERSKATDAERCGNANATRNDHGEYFVSNMIKTDLFFCASRRGNSTPAFPSRVTSDIMARMPFPFSRRCVAASVLFATLTTACITAREQYDEYLVRTDTVRGKDPSAVEAGVFDGGAPDAGFTGTYAMTCLPNLLAGRVDRSLRFIAKISYTGSNLNIELRGMSKTATNLSGGVGNTYNASSSVSADAKFKWDFGKPEFPKEFNTIRDEDIAFSAATMNGILISEKKFCAELGGRIEKPSVVELDESVDVCMIEQVASETAEFPQYARDDFHCP